MSKSRHHPYSRAFAKKVQAVLDEEEPNLLRIENSPALSVLAGDTSLSSSGRQQNILDIFRLSSVDLVRQYTSYFNSSLAAINGGETLSFSHVDIETTISNLSNLDVFADFWLVTCKDSTPNTGSYVASLSSVITQGLSTSNMPVTGVDTGLTVVTPGVLPYDSQLFCQNYTLGKKHSLKLSPGQTIKFHHTRHFDPNPVPLSEFYDAVADLYNFVDHKKWSLGMIVRFHGEIGRGVTTSGSTSALGYLATELGLHNVYRWHFAPAHAAIQTSQRAVDAALASPFTGTFVQGPGISTAVAPNYL